ncbi:MAG: nascent polypeptide-associated complex protein [Candidatus Diapherotrites archaeon]|jgi:nascent polypeptide-associated complex subunit alpha|uniref:Nascent polypeptide-associated complex protein n=1 Tax=Candidatus Iainarchaeum sp. TaxID=3101447 RepID=A0A7K4BZJ2_9ARCH|nr:nascent polypeptide-associated complex protein [Candidatus Diapherotrites archaeon]
MFPGGVNPRQMAQMMKQMGIKVDEIKAQKVVFELENGKKLIFDNPQIQAMTMQGKKTYTLIGEATEEENIPQEDIDMVSDQTGKTKEEAKKALEETKGDIAEAILKLK